MDNQDQVQLIAGGFFHNQAPDAGEEEDSVEAGAHIKAYLFGPFRAVPYARLLERAGTPVPVSSRAFDLLCLLVSRPGEVVSKSELMTKTWPNLTVEEGSLRFHITQLRRALGDNRGSDRYVMNVPGRGYCFVAGVHREALQLGQKNNPQCSARPVEAVRRFATSR